MSIILNSELKLMLNKHQQGSFPTLGRKQEIRLKNLALRTCPIT